MTTWYAQSGSCNIADAGWNDQADGLGDNLVWAALANGDILEANAQTAIEIDGNVGSASVQVTLRTLSGGGFTVNLGAGSNRVEYIHILAGTTACVVQSGNTNSWTQTGNVTGGGSANAHGFNIGATAADKFTFSGNILGGSNSTARGISSGASASRPVVNGNVTGGSAAPGIYLATVDSDILRVNGIVAGGSGSGAVGVLSTQYLFLVLGTNGQLAYSAQWVSPISGVRVKWTVADGSAATITVYDATPTAHVLYVPDYPTEAEVQKDVDYDYGDKTGTYEGGGGGAIVPQTIHPIEAGICA